MTAYATYIVPVLFAVGVVSTLSLIWDYYKSKDRPQRLFNMIMGAILFMGAAAYVTVAPKFDRQHDLLHSIPVK